MLTFFHHFCIKPFIFLLGFYCQLKKKTFDEIEKISVISGAIYCKPTFIRMQEIREVR